MPKREVKKTDVRKTGDAKWTTERAKQESEQAVLKEFATKSPQRWGELLKNTKLSSRTLKKALERLQERQLVNREVEQGIEYPPPVFYGLSSQGEESIRPMIFASYAKNSIFNPTKEETTLNTAETQPKFESFPFQKAPPLVIRLKPEIADEKERLAAVGRRIGVFYLFMFLKAIEDGNQDWMPEAKSLLEYDSIIEAALGYGTPEYEKLLTENRNKPGQKVFRDIVSYTSPLVVPSKAEIQKTRECLKQAFPQERKFLSSLESFIEFAKDV